MPSEISAPNGWLSSATKAKLPIQGKRRPSPPGLFGTVIHATKGPSPPWFIKKHAEWKKQTSWHFTVLKNGDFYQHVPLTNTAVHAGRTFWNQVSLGIELANWLSLAKQGERYHPYNWKEKMVKTKRSPKIRKAIQCEHATTADGVEIELWWETYPSAQIKGLKRLLSDIADAGWPEALYKVRRHSDVSKSGKRDPGPAFPWDEFAAWTDRTYKQKLGV